MEQTTRDAAPRALGPNHRDLWVLVAGVVLGVALGPAVLGRLAPAAYQRMFVGPAVQDAVTRYETEAQAFREARARMAATGATEAGLLDFDARYEPRLTELRREMEAALAERAAAPLRHAARMHAMVLAILAVMVIETLIDPRSLALRSRLATARYALIALWVALLLAQPQSLRDLPLLFSALLVIVALGASLVPLRRGVTRP